MAHDDQSEPPTYIQDAVVRRFMAQAGYPVESWTAGDRFASHLEYVRIRYGEKEAIKIRDAFVDDRMEAQTRRTKRHTTIIIWGGGIINGVVIAVLGAVAVAKFVPWLMHP